MKAVILAAGMGVRLGGLTSGRPKGMLCFDGLTLIERQIETLRGIGLVDINMVTGYCAEAIAYSDVRYYHNPNYAETNMVETLMCMGDDLVGDLLVVYSDIAFAKSLAEMTVNAKGDVCVAVDNEWRGYWMARYGTTEIDLETLSVDDAGRIVELGRAVESSEGIEHRYVGLIRFSADGLRDARELHGRKRASDEEWQQSGRCFKQGFMTDLIHEMVQMGTDVRAAVSHRGWVEFDTPEDYECACRLSEAGELPWLKG